MGHGLQGYYFPDRQQYLAIADLPREDLLTMGTRSFREHRMCVAKAGFYAGTCDKPCASGTPCPRMLDIGELEDMRDHDEGSNAPRAILTVSSQKELVSSRKER
jgi:hypothetical protein